MDVRVYADDILIYENVGLGNIFMKSNGKVWHFIAVNDENKDIKIEIKPVYEDNDVIVPVYTAGNYYDIKSGIIADSIIPLIISVFDILCGVIVLFHFSRKRVQRFINSKMVFFGTTAILIGAWSAGETDAVVVLFENRTLAGVFSFLILIFIPFPYIIYIHANLWKKDRIFYRIPLCCSLLNFMLVICLAFAGIMDFKESVIFTHSIWGISFIYVGAAVCNVIKNNEQNRDKMAIANAAAMLILVGVSGADIYLFWSWGSINNDVFGRALVLFYFIFLAHINVLAAVNEFDKARKADFYKELANTDSITKLNNRTAFNHDIENLGSEDEYCIISMDLNNLKQINDTKGHQAGDRYIMNAANN